MYHFPLGLAEGDAFCNRVLERKKIHSNVNNGLNTVIISPRRYGKSSLVLYALHEINTPFERVDLFVTLDEISIAREIIDGVNRLLNKIIGKPEQILTLTKDILKNISKKWSIGTDGVSIELTRTETKDNAQAIRDALVILDEILKKKKKKAVFFIDEFQEITVIAESKGIEGAIRSVAEKSKNLVFIFSGSNRHALSAMFEDRSRPLYMLCDKITLGRIENTEYIHFINKAAQKKWKKHLSPDFFEKLFQLTQLHPYYINLLCGRLFSEEKNIPNADLVEKYWKTYIGEEKSKISLELSKLSLIQKKILILIAHGLATRLTSKEILQKISTTSASVIKAVQALITKDYIYEKEDAQYAIVDPLIESSLRYYFSSNKLI